MPGLHHGCLGVATNIFEPISKLCRPFDVPGGLGWVISTVETARRLSTHCYLRWKATQTSCLLPGK